MDSSSAKKQSQLGMTIGKARALLVKMLLFEMAQKLGRDICFRCSQRIEGIGQFSIEHKIAWLDSEDPAALYFDLSNVAFSHLSCNSAVSKNPRKKARPGEIWCPTCQASKPPMAFRPYVRKRGWGVCTACNGRAWSKSRSERRRLARSK